MVLIYRFGPRSSTAMVLVKPATVLRGIARASLFYWRGDHVVRDGQDQPEIRDLTRMSRANHFVGCAALHGSCSSSASRSARPGGAVDAVAAHKVPPGTAELSTQTTFRN